MAVSIERRRVALAPAPGTCKLCHTVEQQVTQAGLDAGDSWRCHRCGQMWDAVRILAVANHSLTKPEWVV